MKKPAVYARDTSELPSDRWRRVTSGVKRVPCCLEPQDGVLGFRSTEAIQNRSWVDGKVFWEVGKRHWKAVRIFFSSLACQSWIFLRLLKYLPSFSHWDLSSRSMAQLLLDFDPSKAKKLAGVAGEPCFRWPKESCARGAVRSRFWSWVCDALCSPPPKKKIVLVAVYQGPWNDERA